MQIRGTRSKGGHSSHCVDTQISQFAGATCLKELARPSGQLPHLCLFPSCCQEPKKDLQTKSSCSIHDTLIGGEQTFKLNLKLSRWPQVLDSRCKQMSRRNVFSLSLVNSVIESCSMVGLTFIRPSAHASPSTCLLSAWLQHSPSPGYHYTPYMRSKSPSYILAQAIGAIPRFSWGIPVSLTPHLVPCKSLPSHPG